MLNKRTNILLDQSMWDYLVILSKKKGQSVGDLVRHAIKETYIDDETRLQKQRLNALESIMELKKSIKYRFTTQEIKESIEYGRKY